MGRDVTYEEDIECEVCGNVGAVYYQEGYVCNKCIKILEEGEEYCRQQVPHSVKCPNCGFTISPSDF